MEECLMNSQLFQGFSAQQITEVTALCTALTLDDGELLIEESDVQDRDLYLLCHGSVEIISKNAQSTSNEAVISKEHNELFGEMAWLSGEKRTASVRAYGRVQAIRIEGGAFFDYLQDHPDVGFLFMRRLSLMISRRLTEASNLLKQILWSSML